jgi:putative ABC transport system permease protein
MLKNYVKIAWRNLRKNKIFSLINILGLSVGIAFTLLIGAYVWGEMQVNSQLKDVDNQYIIQSKWKDPNMGFEIASAAELPKALKENYPGMVANYYRFDGMTTNVSKGDMHFRESIQVGDSMLLTMYGFKLLHGHANTALNDPFSVVITGRMALKYFGRTDVVGQVLNIENFSGGKHNFTISGVLDKIPKNSVTSLNASNISDFFFNQDATNYFKRNLSGWQNTFIVDYVELQKGASPKSVEAAMVALLHKNASEQISKNLTPYLVPLKGYNMIAEGGVVKKNDPHAIVHRYVHSAYGDHQFREYLCWPRFGPDEGDGDTQSDGWFAQTTHLAVFSRGNLDRNDSNGGGIVDILTCKAMF